MASLIGLLRLFKLPFISLSSPPLTTFKNQTVLITGASSGVGLEAVRHFVRLGASRVILGARSISKGQNALNGLNLLPPLTTTIDVWEADLDSYASVKAFATKCEKELTRLDVAIMNAGIATGKFELSSEGWEKTLQVNVLSTALLGCLLLPQLINSARAHGGNTPHLTIVGSDAHLQAKFPDRNKEKILESLNTEASFKGYEFNRYCVSKLFDAYIAIELANLSPTIDGRHLVIVNYATPGFCKSGFLTKSGDVPLPLKIAEKILARTPERGALCYVDAACKGEESHGKYLNHQTDYKPGVFVTSDEGIRLRAKVWKEILSILEESNPGFTVTNLSSNA
ncbi:putative short-chain dehydrogenase [Xylogone sp. PMI_703]|nr:putative short-chain dehydrogenase [Xylogone sp. PMI_703]